MAPGVMLEFAIHFAMAAVGVAMAMAGWRVLRGPTAVDRVLAIDTLYINAVMLVVLLGVQLGTGMLFEAALIVSLLGFASTVALARYLSRGDVLE